MVELINISKHYTIKGVRKVIFENLSFRFQQGRNIAIMGRNGVGKSTLMRLIAGAEP
ncbi:MAG: ATP-binding cassette domain-containing protein, partial [Kiritimatiellales bacterium]|nr:ATP-binding cassette domain-containing protein [Kiritimatiellales bacterium]